MWTPIQLHLLLSWWQKSPSLSLSLTHQPRRGLRNSQSLWWRNQPNLHWRDPPRLPPSQLSLTVLPSRGLKSLLSPHHHLLQGRPTPARAQAWPPHALVRWSSSAGKSLSHLRSACSLFYFFLLFFLQRVAWEDQYHFHICMLEQKPGGYWLS